jgi:small subunit ribosomal protein S13
VVERLSESFKAVVRIAGVDLPGNIKTGYALPRVRGIGRSFSNAVLRATNIDPDTPIGQLNEEEISKIEQAIRNPEKFSIPAWMFNRQRDPYLGQSIHLIGPDLLMAIRKDVETMMKIRSWKGIRHSLGLKVRGQRTRTTGRLGQTVGVKRKGVATQQKKEG